MIKKELTHYGFNFKSGTNVFLTGEGSSLKNVQVYCEGLVGLNTIINKNHILEKNFSGCLGAIKIIKDGWETEAIPEVKVKSIEKIGFLSKIFGKY